MDWIETKHMFYNLSRMGVKSINIPPRKFYDLKTLIRENVDDGGSHEQRYPTNTLVFYGIRIEHED